MEADFIKLGIDFRDWYQPDGGESKLTTRRLLLILDKVLDKKTSLFWCAVTDADPVDLHGMVLSDIFLAVSGGQEHYLRDMFYRQSEAEREQIEAQQKQVERDESKAALKQILRG